jgi:hypothetical protein
MVYKPDSERLDQFIQRKGGITVSDVETGECCTGEQAGFGGRNGC